MKVKRKHALLLLAAAFFAGLLLFPGRLAAQCAMCRTALTSSPEGQRWARGIDAGVILLLLAPFLIAGRIAFLIYRPQVYESWRNFLSRCRNFFLREAPVFYRARADRPPAGSP